MEMKPNANNIGVVNRIFPSQMVPNQENIFTPVGTAMIIDVTMKGIRKAGFIPLVNIWCAQTVMPKRLIARLDKAIAL
jgi:hypothetical protein